MVVQEVAGGKMHRHYSILMVFLVAVGLIACRSDRNVGTGEKPNYQYQVPVALGDGWETASLEAVGCDSQAIIAMMEDIQDGGYENLHSLLIVKDGKLVFEHYFGGRNTHSIGDVASVTKSVTSIMVGIAMDQGLIQGPDQSLAELLPAYSEMIQGDPLKAALKLHHILSITSGIEWDEETHPYGDIPNVDFPFLSMACGRSGVVLGDDVGMWHCRSCGGLSLQLLDGPAGF